MWLPWAGNKFINEILLIEVNYLCPTSASSTTLPSPELPETTSELLQMETTTSITVLVVLYHRGEFDLS